MRNLLCLPLLFFVYFLYGQENTVKKPERVIIVNDEIITMEKLQEYAGRGYIKLMNNGVSDEVRARLFEKFGDKIGPKEFIIEISIYSEEEMQKKINSGITVTSQSSEDTVIYVLNVNDRAEDFAVQMINGETIKLSDLKGQVVLLNFWATLCAPCIREFYAFPSEIIDPFKNSAFVLLPVSIGETMEVVKDKMTRLKRDGIDFNVGIDPDKSIFSLYGKGGIPKNFLIDKNGIIRYVSFGYSEEKMNKIVSMVKKLLEE